MATTLFDRLGRPAPTEKAATPTEKAKEKPEPAQLLWTWLETWNRSVVTARDIRNFGPRPIRNRESAIRSAQILVAHGRLVPLAAHKWQVVRAPLTPSP